MIKVECIRIERQIGQILKSSDFPVNKGFKVRNSYGQRELGRVMEDQSRKSSIASIGDQSMKANRISTERDASG